jgi:hypothetical protein
MHFITITILKISTKLARFKQRTILNTGYYLGIVEKDKATKAYNKRDQVGYSVPLNRRLTRNTKYAPLNNNPHNLRLKDELIEGEDSVTILETANTRKPVSSLEDYTQRATTPQSCSHAAGYSRDLLCNL